MLIFRWSDDLLKVLGVHVYGTSDMFKVSLIKHYYSTSIYLVFFMMKLFLFRALGYETNDYVLTSDFCYIQY